MAKLGMDKTIMLYGHFKCRQKTPLIW